MHNMNLHLQHPEDLVILKDKESLINLYNLYEKLLISLIDKENKDLNISVKIDGAPVIFAWKSFAGLKDFGVAGKSLLSKDHISFHVHKDINDATSDKPEYGNKLKLVLDNLKELNIPDGELWVGDYLFDKSDIFDFEYDNKKYLGYQPNTILYGYEKDKDDGETSYWSNKIKDYKYGICFHTKYTGDINNLIKNTLDICTFENESKILLLNPKIILSDAKFDTTHLKDSILIELKKFKIFLNLINSKYYNVIEFKTLMAQYNQYQNSLIKNNINHKKFYDFINGFKRFIKGDKKYLNTAEKRISFIDDNIESFEFIYNLMSQIELIKSLFLTKLNQIMDIQSFVRLNDNTIKRIYQEGFVISDSTLTIKLVDRYEFSSYNFSDSIMKPNWRK